MNGVLKAAVEVDGFLRSTGLDYCLIGGIALQRWGSPRTTLDVDLTVMTTFGDERQVILILLQWLEPRIPDAASFAEQSRVLLAKSPSGVGVDVSLGALPFEARMIGRSSWWSLDGHRSLRTCSAEDLLVQKVFAARDQDWVDVAGVLDRQHASLDRHLVLREVEPLLQLKEDTASLDRIRRLLSA